MDSGRYAVALDLKGKTALVVGAGEVAARKVRGLLEAGAIVQVVAPLVGPAVEAQLGPRCTVVRREFDEPDVDGARLVFAATADPAVNARVIAAARERGAWACDAGDGERGDFTTPVVHRSGPLTFAVDTGGRSPAFAVRLRDELAARYDARFGRATVALGRLRGYLGVVAVPEMRARVLRAFAARPIDELAAMNAVEVENAADEALAGAAPSQRASWSRTLVVATRASALALWQTRFVMARLAERGIVCEILEVATHGDRAQDRPIAALGDDGVFVKELERALRERRADFAVHSCKDLPSVQPADMRLAAFLARSDARDAFCSEHYATFDELPPAARVGTSSPRRRAQLAALRPDVRYEDLRGNVDTRIRKLREGRYEAIVLAVAGLERLGLRAQHTVPFGPEALTGAAGQGALAIECREDDIELAELLHDVLNDAPTERAVVAERAVLRGLDAGCLAPIGAQAHERAGMLELTAVVASIEGARVLRAHRSAAVAGAGEADALGIALAAALRNDGADDVLGRSRPLAGMLFLLARTQERESRIGPALRAAGAEVIEAHDAASAHDALGTRVPDVLLFPSSGSVLGLSSYLEALRAGGRRPLVAAMGPASAAAASERGFPPDAVPGEAAVAPFVHVVTQLVLERTVTP